ncbi:4-(cytidine 5'-diphospho)-2-C-methyl-D-erythritol kinase [Candidatus Nitronereus thalassa]|uniref:4-diphosphocytidyl-2-C-methyl-D-erythritol kinase n=1 Tax=Candidatus Nitronereus thalassa TaxID=3020898 RepID=A0ABU3K7H6_9BACT|nr:4-(cytidine 5'-diphospho)-2-C-methyl-D-erythritol kinase [Candidatus Nitronereus thalassa]MDT7042341.1 4-(cytidine 5'-diphospho)-2-C-methyl-D-erythritol kinase [Candidatus Nitronereus thalassa]
MKNLSRRLVLYPPAKVNLILKIFDLLPKGYHGLWSLMQTIGVTDELTIHVDDSFVGIRLECSDRSVSEITDNLVYRAADVVLRQSSARVGVSMTLKKHIPVAAGLGGGSSDAAATIMGLNHLLALGWSRSDMAKLGQTLGSDVPFFIEGPTAIIRGWGEQIIPKTFHNARWILLVNPGFPINTGQAYKRLDEGRSEVPLLSDHLIEFEQASSLSWEHLSAQLENDFEAVLFRDYPVLADIKKNLVELGAESALLSGSGATMFGVFQDEARAIQAKEVLVKSSGYRVLLGPTMEQGLLGEKQQ